MEQGPGDAHACHTLAQNRNAGLPDSPCAAVPSRWPPACPPQPDHRSSAQAAPSTSQMECDDGDGLIFFFLPRTCRDPFPFHVKLEGRRAGLLLPCHTA